MIKRIKNMDEQLKELAVKNNISNWRTRLWIDSICSRLFLKLTFYEYVSSAYRYSWSIRRNMMSQRNDWKIIPMFNDKHHVHILENKVDFLKHFANNIKHDWIYPKEDCLENFFNFAKRNNDVIIKPIDSLQGKGVKKINLNNFSDNELKDIFKQYQNENILVEECIVQHPDLVFNNKSVNTIRIFTIMDRNEDVHILKTVLRVGKGDSVVDNFCAGGVVYPIDKETGIIDGKGIDKDGNTYIYHACSQIQMIGRKIPYWNDVITTAINAAKEIIQIRYIGWDIVVTQNGIDIIEANHNPDTDFLEFIGENAFLPKILKYK